MKLLIFTCALFALSAAGPASVHVQGTLLCHGKPWVGEDVRVYEKNNFFADSLLANVTTDENGFFSVKASAGEFLTKPRPYVYIVNYCAPYGSPSWMKCGRSLKFYVPDYFVTDGHLTNSLYDLQKIELTTVKNEKQGLERIVYFVFDHIECTDA